MVKEAVSCVKNLPTNTNRTPEIRSSVFSIPGFYLDIVPFMIFPCVVYMLDM